MMRKIGRKVLIEGYSVDEILGLSNEQLDQFVFCGEPIVFRAAAHAAARNGRRLLTDALENLCIAGLGNGLRLGIRQGDQAQQHGDARKGAA